MTKAFWQLRYSFKIIYQYQIYSHLQKPYLHILANTNKTFESNYTFYSLHNVFRKCGCCKNLISPALRNTKTGFINLTRRHTSEGLSKYVKNKTFGNFRVITLSKGNGCHHWNIGFQKMYNTDKHLIMKVTLLCK